MFVDQNSIRQIFERHKIDTGFLGWHSQFMESYSKRLGHDPYNYSAYALNALPELFKIARSEDQLKNCYSLVEDYIARFGEPYGYVGKILPTLIQKTTTEEQLRLWDTEFKNLVQDFQERVGNVQTYVEKSLPRVVRAARFLWQLQMVRMIASNRFSSHNFYEEVEESIPAILNKINSDELLKRLGQGVAPFIIDYSAISNPREFVEKALTKLLKNLKTEEELDLAFGFISDYKEHMKPDDYHYTAYVLNALPDLFRSILIVKQLRVARELVLDYMQHFGEPYDYVSKLLPTILKKAKTEEEVRAYDAKVKQHLKSSGSSGVRDLVSLVERAKTLKEL